MYIVTLMKYQNYGTCSDQSYFMSLYYTSNYTCIQLCSQSKHEQELPGETEFI